MTAEEKTKVNRLWLEVENIITIADPLFDVQKYVDLKGLSKKDLEGLFELLTLLRIEMKYLLFENEALRRENISLAELLEGER